MLDRGLILGALPAGIVLGALTWLIAGRGGDQVEALEPLTTQLHSMTLARPRPSGASPVAIAGVSPPLFGRLNGEVEPPEPTLVLQGVVRTARRQGALIAINGKPADWLSIGETRDGITLQEVNARGAVISFEGGVREISFGAASAPSPTATVIENGPPAGVRSPPPPASAPTSQ